MFLKSEFSNRLVQVSLFSAIVYYITAYPVVFEKARKYFPVKFKKTHHLLLFHTFVFAVLMYVLTYFVFDPLVRVVEGIEGGEDDNSGNTVAPEDDNSGNTVAPEDDNSGNTVAPGSLDSHCDETQKCNDGLVCGQDHKCAHPASVERA